MLEERGGGAEDGLSDYIGGMRDMEGIRLELKDYCERCPHFEITADRIDMTRGNGERLTETTIKCKRADICQRMYQSLVNRIAEMR